MSTIITGVIDENRGTHTYYVDKPDKCPICNMGIDAQLHTSFLKKLGANNELRVVFSCPLTSCHNFFIAHYTGIHPSTTTASMKPTLRPVNFIPEDFGNDILKITTFFQTDFFDIYNQASHAESLGLTSICGPGYRKAIEHLIKDYALYIVSEQADKDKIISPKYTLSTCITEHLTSHVQVFSKVATRYGNDETHYTKQNNSDLDDLKRMIRAVLIGITYEINLKEAEGIIESK